MELRGCLLVPRPKASVECIMYIIHNIYIYIYNYVFLGWVCPRKEGRKEGRNTVVASEAST